MVKRLESPSSINTFKQCKRKYYYQYIQKLPTFPSIHTVRGNIAHSVLEDFYNITVKEFKEEDYELKFKAAIQKIFVHQWGQYKPQLTSLNLNKDQERFYFEETMLMLMNWINHFLEEFNGLKKKKNLSLEDTFVKLTPIREQEYRSDEYYVHGFIDAIRHLEDEVHIIDYKTNATFDLKDSIKLQLAIYSLLYTEKHGKAPSKVGIFFLRHKLKLMTVDAELMNLAKREVQLVHAHTSKTEALEDYPKTITSLCKWSSGQCDFYGACKPHEK